MTSAKSLSGLCTICYAEEPKYRCPRCKSQTCSLPCYKRHQQRASCNGQRNPAAYVKKSEWATASGIDHDYNYLKSVERNIERADDNVQPRTFDGHGSIKRHREQWRMDSPLQRYLSEHKITVQRAPEGMSRSRLNKTRHTQKGKVFWTVEFIDDSGQTYIDDDCLSSNSLADLWQIVVSRKRKADTRPITNTIRSSKRSKIEDQPESTAQVSPADIQDSSEGNAVNPSRDAAADAADDESKATDSSDRPSTHFYLVRAKATSPKRILIPIDAKQSLSELLRSRTIQEFPTFYSLPFAAHELPESFLLEKDYLSGLKEDKGEVAPPREIFNSSRSHPAVESPLETEKILEMLRRDLT